MELKDMILSVVYQNPDGMHPLQIVEALAQLGMETNTKQILKIIDKNPKLFIEKDGKIKSASKYSQ